MTLSQLSALLMEHGAFEMEQRRQEAGNRCQEALMLLQDHTFGRLDGQCPEEVLQCAALCWLELERRLRTLDQEEETGRVTSETVGGWSRSWSAPEQGSRTRGISRCLDRYLGHTGLLYRGEDGYDL